MEVRVMKGIMDANGEIAAQNREHFAERNISVVNVLASPGAGKTTLIMAICEHLRGKRKVYVVEGDISSSIDAEKLDKMGVSVIQINTGGGCHLDANMLREAISVLSPEEGSLILIENVGNLVCPAAFDLGDSFRLLVASVPEGNDKPYKYVSMFSYADAVVLSKMDLLPYIDFDMANFETGVHALAPAARNIPIYKLSCKTGEGMKSFLEWIEEA
ncbi:MAG: hydrogenase nickel incorporation protein HypB [Bacillota bacterium]